MAVNFTKANIKYFMYFNFSDEATEEYKIKIEKLHSESISTLDARKIAYENLNFAKQINQIKNDFSDNV